MLNKTIKNNNRENRKKKENRRKERKKEITSNVVCPSRLVSFHRRFVRLGCGRRRGVAYDGGRHWTLVSGVSWGMDDGGWAIDLTSKVAHNHPITTTGAAQSGIGLVGFVWHGGGCDVM